jgi:hypothetical protein
MSWVTPIAAEKEAISAMMDSIEGIREDMIFPRFDGHL